MDVISGILGELEMKYFNADDFGNFVNVMDDTVARYVLNYINNPAANPEIVAHVEKHIGWNVRQLTAHLRMSEMGITKLIQQLTPETLLESENDLDAIESNLSYLEEHADELINNITPRSKDSFNTFKATISGVLHRMRMEGVKPTYPETMDRIEANSFLFYKPNDRGRSTGVGIINMQRSRWMSCLYGIRWNNYCVEHNIGAIERREF